MTNPEKPENLRARSARYADKMRAKGMIKVTVWIKKECAEKLRKYVEKLK